MARRLLALVLTGSAGSCAVLGNDSALASQMEALIRRRLPARARFGVAVYSLTRKEWLVGRAAGSLYVPASNAKLFTSAAALLYLGPGHHLETEVMARGRVAGGVLHGDVVVRGEGDPTLAGLETRSVMRRWAAALGGLGIRQVAGGVVFDESAFAGPATHPTWPAGQRLEWYCAPVGALNLDGNCVRVTVTPGREAPRVRQNPDVGALRVQVVPGAAGRPARIDRPEGKDDLILHGIGSRTWSRRLTVSDPGRLFALGLLAALRDAGLRVDGGVRRSKGPVRPGPGVLLVARRSVALAGMLAEINKRSHNLSAECLLRHLGYKMFGSGSFGRGAEAIRRILEPAGVTGFQVADGSGLSKSNACSPEQVVRLLAHMDSSRSGKLFFDSLAVSGVDGSMARRLAGRLERGRVRAKTGYVRDAGALSGVVQGRGDRLAFSMLCNGFQSGGPYVPNLHLKGLQDDLCRLMLAHADRVRREGSLSPRPPLQRP